MSFDYEYFNGVAYNIYINFPVHYKTASLIEQKSPKSVLDVGGARGYIVKILEQRDIPSTVIDISTFAHAERVTDSFILWDITVTPWDSIKDKEYDLLFSCATFEHIPEDKIDAVIRECERVSNKGFIAVQSTVDKNDKDKTHVTIKPIEWWKDKFHSICPNYPVEIVPHEAVEGNWKESHKYLPFSPGLKLNIGSAIDQFYHNWINIDVNNLLGDAQLMGTRFRHMDVSLGIKERDDSVDAIVTSHLIEHFNRKDGKSFLKDCFRIMKSGGVLRVAVPDLGIIASKYVEHRLDDFKLFNGGARGATDPAEILWSTLTDGHQTAYDYEALSKLLSTVGFINIERSSFNTSKYDIIRKETWDLHPEISLYVECTKP